MKTALMVGALSCASVVASAQFLALGDLTDGTSQSATFPEGSSSGVNDSTTWHMWTFNANAGDMIDITVFRVGPSLDPMSAAFVGDATGMTVPVGVPLWETTTVSAALGLEFAGSGDDEVDDPYGGPWGDPSYGFMATETGTYTVFVANFLSLPTGEQRYDITVSGSTWIPAPSAMALLGMGGLVAGRRRR